MSDTNPFEMIETLKCEIPVLLAYVESLGVEATSAHIKSRLDALYAATLVSIHEAEEREYDQGFEDGAAMEAGHYDAYNPD